MAAAERSREEPAAETCDRMPLPEDMRGALRDRPRLGHRLYRLAPRPESPRPAPAEPSEPPAPQPEPGDPGVPAALPPPHPSAGPWRTNYGGLRGLLRALILEGARHQPEASASVPAPLLPAEPGRRADVLALRFWPDGKPDPARALSCRRIHPPVPVPTAPGIPAVPSIRLRRVRDRAARTDGVAGRGAAGTGPPNWRERLVRVGRHRHIWFGATALILLALVGYQTGLDPRLGATDEHGQALEQRGELPAALEQHRRASERDPGNPLLLYRWAQALEQHGELEQALATYRRAAALSLRALRTAGD